MMHKTNFDAVDVVDPGAYEVEIGSAEVDDV